MDEALSDIQATTGHQSVQSAYTHGISEGMPYVELIVLFQKRSVNDVADFFPVFIPVCVCKRDRNAFQLCGQGVP